MRPTGLDPDEAAFPKAPREPLRGGVSEQSTVAALVSRSHAAAGPDRRPRGEWHGARAASWGAGRVTGAAPGRGTGRRAHSHLWRLFTWRSGGSGTVTRETPVPRHS